MPIAYNTKGFSAYFPAPFGLLVPQPATHLERALEKLSGKRDYFGNDKLGDGAGVGEGRVEYRDTGFGSRDEIDLVCTDAEASDD